MELGIRGDVGLRLGAGSAEDWQPWTFLQEGVGRNGLVSAMDGAPSQKTPNTETLPLLDPLRSGDQTI